MDVPRSKKSLVAKSILLQRKVRLLKKTHMAIQAIHSIQSNPEAVAQSLLREVFAVHASAGVGIWQRNKHGFTPLHLIDWPEGLTNNELHCCVNADPPRHFYLRGYTLLTELLTYPAHEQAIVVSAIKGLPRRYPSRASSLSCLTQNASLALKRLHMFEASKTQADYMELLHQLSRRFAAKLSLKDLFKSIYTEVGKVMLTDLFFVALFHEESSEVELCFGYERGRELPTRRYKLNEGPTSQVIKTKEPLMYTVDSSTLPPGAQRLAVPDKDTLSVMMVPIMLQDRVLGVLSVQGYESHSHTQENLQVLSTIASQAAIALENAKLYEQTLTMASTDSMTGLKNGRAFYESLDSALSTASANGQQLSLIMIDSDSLKEINDLYGHSTGDEHIRHLASAIMSCVRPRDVVARYGGDEFMIMLPDTNATAAKSIAQDVVERVRAASFTVNGKRVRVTVSAGVATYPQDASNREDLVKTADAAMYQAKHTGKDRSLSAADLTAT